MLMTKPNPILLDIPDHIETERMTLRIPRPGDGAMIHASVEASREALRPWMSWADDHAEESEVFARRAAAHFLLREEITYLMLHPSTGQHIGNCGLHSIQWDVRRFEIGYWLNTAFQGQGYMLEAVHRLTDLAFTRLEAVRVEIRCDARNTRSRSVAERAGYLLEGHFRQNDFGAQGELRDMLIFAKIREEAAPHGTQAETARG